MDLGRIELINRRRGTEYIDPRRPVVVTREEEGRQEKPKGIAEREGGTEGGARRRRPAGRPADQELLTWRHCFLIWPLVPVSTSTRPIFFMDMEKAA